MPNTSPPHQPDGADGNALGYRPLEYWKGPKKVHHHVRARSSRSGGALGSLLSTRPEIRHSRPKSLANAMSLNVSDSTATRNNRGLARPPAAQSTLRSGAFVDDEKNHWQSQGKENRGGGYILADATAVSHLAHAEDSTSRQQANPHDTRFKSNMGFGDDFEHDRRRKKKFFIVGGIVLLIVVVVAIVVPVVVIKNRDNAASNSYPNYTKLSYTLHETYSGTNFWDKFNYFEGYDPSHGFVHYVPKARATTELNLTTATATSAILKVDTTVGPGSNPDASTGRFSVRVESKSTYSSGLFLFDVLHTPYGCATWPALWLADLATWPSGGEIDVFEAVNQGTKGNVMSLHTSKGCNMEQVIRNMTGSVAVAQSGSSTLQLANCDSSANGNAGCGVAAPTVASYGPAFNALGGGVMALEWRGEGLRMWQFARSPSGGSGGDLGGIPQDILAKQPDPSTWGPALADFPNTKCDIGNHFKNQSLVVNIDLCGDLVFPTYAQSGCPSANSCTDFVAKNPSAFETAFWEFASFEVYQAA